MIDSTKLLFFMKLKYHTKIIVSHNTTYSVFSIKWYFETTDRLKLNIKTQRWVDSVGGSKI